ncbi:MAG: rod shape-determining protein MreC [Candidatus Brocadiaceae bacterium]
MKTSNPNFSSLVNNPLTTIVTLLALSLVLLFSPAKLSNRIRMACAVPMRPLQLATCFCSNSASNFLDRIIATWQNTRMKQGLEDQVSLYKNKILEQQDTIYKLESKLRMLAKFQAENKNSKTTPITADIIGYDTSNFRKSITINAGLKHGVKQGDIVISNNALVGRVTMVSRGSSVVQLITDPASRIPGRVVQTREQVLLEGNATAFCQLKYVPRWAKLKKGDDVVSSEIGGVYPPSLPIATVVETEMKGGALFQSVKVLPKVNIANIESVLVITH